MRNTGKSFEEALADLVSEYVTRKVNTDELISAMELQIMALKEEGVE